VGRLKGGGREGEEKVKVKVRVRVRGGEGGGKGEGRGREGGGKGEGMVQIYTYVSSSLSRYYKNCFCSNLLEAWSLMQLLKRNLAKNMCSIKP
jgi:hypothetical protein